MNHNFIIINGFVTVFIWKLKKLKKIFLNNFYPPQPQFCSLEVYLFHEDPLHYRPSLEMKIRGGGVMTY